ncbi:MAG: sigma 54-interacting transcriptional regulator [bacterium]
MNVLITVVGKSPQVVTETWQKLQEDGIIINEIVTFHTTDKDVIKSVDELKQQFSNRQVKITSISLGFDEVNELEQNNQFTRVVFAELWKRRIDSQELHISIAGGRKTMSALLYWVAQLVGAKNITHVLASSDIENSKDFFPASDKYSLVKLSFIDLFPTVLQLCNIYKLDLNDTDKVLEKIQDLPQLISGLMPRVIDEVFPSNNEWIDFKSKKMLELKEKLLKQITEQPFAHILIFGETGVGKEYLVKFINNHTPGKKRKLINLNCAGVTSQLADSELFGYKKGAFTGAITDKPGIVEEAQDGDLFLDEIGELMPEVQAKLLRFIQSGEYRPLGANKTEILNNVRVIAATNREPNSLRRDFYERFTFNYTIPPLRERPEDLKQFLEVFLKQRNKTIHKDAVSLLLKYNWPGNFRSLSRVLEQAGLSCSPHTEISAEAIKEAIDKDAMMYPQNVLPEVEEKTRIENTLKAEHGNIKNAAQKLNISKSTLYSKLKQYGIDAHKYR